MARRKAAVVAAVCDGRITMEEALHRYQLTEEEFLSWQHAFESHGIGGLRVTFIQQISGTAAGAETDKAAPALRRPRCVATNPRGQCLKH